MPQQNNIPKNKKKKKKINSDTIAVLFILAIIILIGIFVSWMQRDGSTKDISQSISGGHKATVTNNDVVIVTVGVVAVVIVAIFVIVKVSVVKKKKRILLEKIKKQKELEEARKRVEAAKYSDILAAGHSVLKERKLADKIIENKTNSVRHKYDLNNIDDLDDELIDNKHHRYGDGNDRLNTNEYRSYRRSNLKDDLDDDLDNDFNSKDDYESEDYEGFLEKIKQSYKKIVIYGVLGIAVILSFILIFVLL